MVHPLLNAVGYGRCCHLRLVGWLVDLLVGWLVGWFLDCGMPSASPCCTTGNVEQQCMKDDVVELNGYCKTSTCARCVRVS